jgi:hypothetical protein
MSPGGTACWRERLHPAVPLHRPSRPGAVERRNDLAAERQHVGSPGRSSCVSPASLVDPMPQKSWRRLIGPCDPSSRIFAWGAWLLLASPILFFAYLLFFKGHSG